VLFCFVGGLLYELQAAEHAKARWRWEARPCFVRMRNMRYSLEEIREIAEASGAFTPGIRRGSLLRLAR
jgi:hypothetical protein